MDTRFVTLKDISTANEHYWASITLELPRNGNPRFHVVMYTMLGRDTAYESFEDVELALSAARRFVADHERPSEAEMRELIAELMGEEGDDNTEVDYWLEEFDAYLDYDDERRAGGGEAEVDERGALCPVEGGPSAHELRRTR